MALNEFQKSTLGASVDFMVEGITDLIGEGEGKITKDQAALAFDAVFDDAVYNNKENRQFFEKFDIKGSIDSLRQLVRHPCPQNNAGSYEYAVQEPGISMRKVNQGTPQERIIKEPTGMLRLTAQNDDITPHVTKEDVLEFLINMIVDKQVGEESPTLSQERIKRKTELTGLNGNLQKTLEKTNMRVDVTAEVNIDPNSERGKFIASTKKLLHESHVPPEEFLPGVDARIEKISNMFFDINQQVKPNERVTPEYIQKRLIDQSGVIDSPKLRTFELLSSDEGAKFLADMMNVQLSAGVLNSPKDFLDTIMSYNNPVWDKLKENSTALRTVTAHNQNAMLKRDNTMDVEFGQLTLTQVAGMNPDQLKILCSDPVVRQVNENNPNIVRNVRLVNDPDLSNGVRLMINTNYGGKIIDSLSKSKLEPMNIGLTETAIKILNKPPLKGHEQEGLILRHVHTLQGNEPFMKQILDMASSGETNFPKKLATTLSQEYAKPEDLREAVNTLAQEYKQTVLNKYPSQSQQGRGQFL